MIYGRSYEGHTRECERCGHFTNVHIACDRCEVECCENCAFGAFCCQACSACEHADIRLVAVYDDIDASAGYAARVERYACQTCGEQFDGDDFPPPPAERKPAIAATGANTERKAA